MQEQLPLFNIPAGSSFSTYYAGSNAAQVDHIKEFCSTVNEQCLFIWGPRGVGKTHILQAACQKISNDGRPVAFIPLSEFKIFDVRIFDALEHSDIICVDDVHAIAGNMSWEVALFDLYNRARQHNTRIILSSALNVKELGLTLRDLESRLLWGLVMQIKPLSDQEKIQAMQLRAEQRGFNLNFAVCTYLINHFPRDMDSLFNVLNTLDKASLAQKRKITVPFIKQLLLIKSKS